MTCHLNFIESILVLPVGLDKLTNSLVFDLRNYKHNISVFGPQGGDKTFTWVDAIPMYFYDKWNRYFIITDREYLFTPSKLTKWEEGTIQCVGNFVSLEKIKLYHKIRHVLPYFDAGPFKKMKLKNVVDTSGFFED